MYVSSITSLGYDAQNTGRRIGLRFQVSSEEREPTVAASDGRRHQRQGIAGDPHAEPFELGIVTE